MTRALMVVGAAVLAGTALFGQQRPAAASLDKARLEAAINKEVIDGDLKGAIAMYRDLTRSADRAVAAQSYLRLGQSYRRLGDPQAKPALQRVLDFKDQPALVAKARAALGQSSPPTTGTPANSPAMRRVWSGADVDTSGAVSPDGLHIAYVDRGTGDLAVRDLETGVSRRLTAEGNEWKQFAGTAAFSPDGSQIAYSWFGANSRYEVRVVDAKATGVPTPRTLVNRADIEWVGVTDWSRDGKSLAAIYGTRGGVVRIATVSVTDGTVQDMRSPLDSRPTKLLFSPDGRFVAYDVLRNNNTDDRDIVIRSLTDQRESFVAPAPAYDALMGWSPDGTMLIFASDRSGVNALWVATVSDGRVSGEPRKVYANAGNVALGMTTKGALVVGVTASRLEVNMVAVDTTTGKRLGEPERPLQRIGAAWYPAWSPDGTRLVFIVMRYRSGQGHFLGIYDSRNGSVRELRTNMQHVVFPRWSPDGQALVLQGRDKEGKEGIFRVSVETGDVTAIALNVEGAFNHWPSWPGDGQRVYFGRNLQNKGHVTVERDLKTGRERELSEARAGIASPDGRFLLASPWSDDRIGELRLVPTAGGPSRVIYSVSEGGLPWANWTPDGKHVLVKHVGKGHDDVLLVPVDGGAPRKLDLPGAKWGWMAMHPDGKRIAYLAGEHEEDVWVIENFLPSPKVVR